MRKIHLSVRDLWLGREEMLRRCLDGVVHVDCSSQLSQVLSVAPGIVETSSRHEQLHQGSGAAFPLGQARDLARSGGSSAFNRHASPNFTRKNDENKKKDPDSFGQVVMRLYRKSLK